ncbi:MAG: pilin [Patescibacteria group bacterium]|jgi:hypothetical protein
MNKRLNFKLTKTIKVIIFMGVLVLGTLPAITEAQVCQPTGSSCIYLSGVPTSCVEDSSCSSELVGSGLAGTHVCYAKIDSAGCRSIRTKEDCDKKYDFSGKNRLCEWIEGLNIPTVIDGQVATNTTEEEKEVEEKKEAEEKKSTGSTVPSLPAISFDFTFPNPLSGVSSPNVLIGKVINYVMGLVGTLALIMLIYGGISWMVSSGNPEKVKKSMNIIVWSVLGLAAVFLSYALVQVLITIVK